MHLGRIFGRRKVIDLNPEKKNHNWRVAVKCECGKIQAMRLPLMNQSEGKEASLMVEQII